MANQDTHPTAGNVEEAEAQPNDQAAKNDRKQDSVDVEKVISDRLSRQAKKYERLLAEARESSVDARVTELQAELDLYRERDLARRSEMHVDQIKQALLASNKMLDDEKAIDIAVELLRDKLILDDDDKLSSADKKSSIESIINSFLEQHSFFCKASAIGGAGSKPNARPGSFALASNPESREPNAHDRAIAWARYAYQKEATKGR